MTYQEIIDHLHSLANPEMANRFQRVFKTVEGEYSFGDKFLGIRVPVIRQATKKFKVTSVSTVEEILKSE